MADPSPERADPGDISSLGSVVVLMASRNNRLTAEAAIELCSEWADAGRRMVLADFHLESPILHELLGVENLEGMVDIFLYGASLSRIARPVLDSAFLFIPAGTYPSDPEEVYSNSRWKKLVAGFRESDATLAVFAPSEEGALAALSEWSSELVLLDTADREEIEHAKRLGFRVRGEGISLVDPMLELEPEEEEAGATIWPPAPLEGPDLPTSAPGVIRLPESELELPPPPVRDPARRSAGSPVLWILLVAVVLATVAYLLFSLKPDLIPGASAEAAAAVAPPAPPAAISGPVPYSVPVRAFSTFAAAQEEVAANQLRLPSVPFYTSAEVQQGVLYYRVFAGTSADSISAEVLRRDLVGEGIVVEADSPGSWSFIELTPYAFDLGEHVSAAEAVEHLDSLRVRSIPAYATVIPYSDGSRRWQLYGGAFRDSVSAEGMRDILTAAGFDPPLTVRLSSRRPPLPGAAAE